MKRGGPDLDPELEALLEPRRIQRHLPPQLRARVLARARATLAGEVIPPASVPEATPMRAARGGRLFRLSLAASLAVAAGAAGAVAALHARNALAPAAAPPESAPPPPAPIANVDRRSRDDVTATSERAAPPRPPRPAHAGAKADPFTAELELVQRAHAAYTRRDFSVALAFVAEHAQRFPRSPLAEQREALRVRSLAGAGRADEARRAAAAFAVRFPRSVLLPRLAERPESPQR